MVLQLFLQFVNLMIDQIHLSSLFGSPRPWRWQFFWGLCSNAFMTNWSLPWYSIGLKITWAVLGSILWLFLLRLLLNIALVLPFGSSMAVLLQLFENLEQFADIGVLGSATGHKRKLEVRFQVYRYACRQAYEKMQHIFRCPLQGSWHTRIYIACHKTCGYDSFLRACTTLYECSSMIKTAYIHLHVYYACLGMYASIPTSNSVLFVCVNVCLLIFTWSCMYLSVFACVILHAGMACTILHARMPAYMDGWMDLWMHEWLKNEHIMSYMDPAWYLNTNLCMRIWGCMHVYMNQLCDSAFGPWMICIFI